MKSERVYFKSTPINCKIVVFLITLFASFLFSQDSTGTLTDIDGNVYKTIKIGEQWWMAENLKVTHYRNGDPIPNITGNTEWKNLSTGAYCNYENDTSNVATYGRLYNWYAVKDSCDIAPEGWHVSTDAEWQTLIDYLGGSSVAGGKLKETGTTHWYSPNAGATNESGFSALPAGYRCSSSAYFGGLGHGAHFWSASEYSISYVYARHLYSSHSEVSRTYYNEKQTGYSIRLVRD